MHLNIFPKPYHNAYPFDPKDGTHPSLFHGVRSLTAADRPRHSIDASVCLRFSKVARQGTQSLWSRQTGTGCETLTPLPEL